jgi:putative transposase
VDTQGFVLAVSVQAGDVQDRDGAKEVLGYCRGTYPRLSLVWADSAYAGELVSWTASCCGWTLEIVKKSEDQKEKSEDQKEKSEDQKEQNGAKGFAVQPHRWIVERTFAWLCKYRRLVRDYEFLTESSEAMIRLAMCHVMLRRLKKA